jgi:hypothetical protein
LLSGNLRLEAPVTGCLWAYGETTPACRNVNFDAEELAPYMIEMLTHDLGDECGSNVYRSTDQSKSFDRTLITHEPA